MKKIVLTFLAFTSLLGASMMAGLADANSTPQLTTVSWVLKTRNESGTDGRFVTLIGRVIERNGNTYWFTDGTGTMRLSAGKLGLPMGRTLVVVGRIEDAFLDLGPVEVVVKNWHAGIVP